MGNSFLLKNKTLPKLTYEALPLQVPEGHFLLVVFGLRHLSQSGTRDVSDETILERPPSLLSASSYLQSLRSC